jgi:hypothetical protein
MKSRFKDITEMAPVCDALKLVAGVQKRRQVHDSDNRAASAGPACRKLPSPRHIPTATDPDFTRIQWFRFG